MLLIFLNNLINALFFFCFWFLLSGKTEAFYLFAGAVSSALLAYSVSSRRKNTTVDLNKLAKTPLIMIRACFYGIWLLGRIIMAALHVSKIILTPKLPIKPNVFRHKTILISDIEKVIFANSITLTPGTISVDIEKDHLLIHQLDSSSNEDIVSHTMEKEIQKILGKNTQ